MLVLVGQSEAFGHIALRRCDHACLSLVAWMACPCCGIEVAVACDSLSRDWFGAAWLMLRCERVHDQRVGLAAKNG